MLYELLALREPFRGRTIEDTFHDICLKAMQKEPRGRYSNIMDIVREIRQFCEQTMLGPTGS